MAQRGSPIPWATKERLGEFLAMPKDDRPSYRVIADELEVSKTTVQKYAHKFGTKPLSPNVVIAYSST